MYYKIRALDPNINFKHSFWLWAANREDLDLLLQKKNIDDIDSIEEDPEFKERLNNEKKED